MTSEGVFVSEEILTEEYNEQCKKIRDYMINLWSSARKTKCGDDGWVPQRGVEDPMQVKDDAEKKY